MVVREDFMNVTFDIHLSSLLAFIVTEREHLLGDTVVSGHDTLIQPNRNTYL